MSKYSSFKKFQLITESFRKFLKEDEGGAYSIDFKYSIPRGFYRPDGEELLGADGEYELESTELLDAIEKLPEFAQLIDIEKLKAWREAMRAEGRSFSTWPDPDYLERYAKGGLFGIELWSALFKIYLAKVLKVPNPQVGEYVAPDDDDDDYDY
tara:strand:+ start:91 stop:552 length:462 start_codon:yes stop_codon:yes gene_type:complete